MPPPYSAGSVFLQVVPSFAGVQEDIATHAERYGKVFGEKFDEGFNKETKENLGKHVGEAMKGAEAETGRAGGRAGKKYAEGFAKEASSKTGTELVRALDRNTDDTGKAGERAGRKYAGKFASTLKAQLGQMSKQIDAIRIDADTDPALAKLAHVREAAHALAKAKIGVDVDAETAAQAVHEMERILDDISKQAVSIRTRVDADQAAKDAAVVRKMVETVLEKPIDVPIRVEQRQLGAFEQSIKSSISQALKAMPPLDLDDNPATEKITRIRESLLKLDQKRIGIDVSGEQALAELALIQAAVQDLNRSGVDIQTRFDSAQLLAALDAAQKRVNDLDGSKANIDIHVKKVEVEEKASERLIGNFERTFRKSIEAALHNLPPIELNVDDASVSAEVDRIRRELSSLRDARLGVDLSSDDALTKLRALMAELHALDGQTADVKVRSDVATTYKELRSIFKLVEALEGKKAKVDAGAPGAPAATAKLRQLNSESKKSSVNGMDAANAFRAFNGRIFAFVALAPAAVPLLGALAGGLAAIGPAALAGLAGVGVATLGFSGIGNAVQGLNDVQDNAAKDAVSRSRTMRGASRGVRDAEQALARARTDGATAVEDAGRRVEGALRSQQQAEKQLRQAQEDSRRAQEDLIAAREEGKNQLEDLSLRARGGALAERQASLDLAKAQAEYIAVMADGSATKIEREQVAIALERETLGYEQARLENQRLQEQQAEAARTGIEGTQAYQSALGQVVSANADVENAQRGVEDANRDVATANREAARAQVDAAQSVADATQSLADAQDDYQTALESTGDVGSASMQRLNKAMAELGPAGVAFAEYLHGLRPLLRQLRGEAQAGLLPGVQGWMQSITDHYGPDLLRTVRGLSGAVGDVFAMWGQSLEGDAFASLFAMIENDGPRWIRDMGTGVTDLGEGFAYLLVAARPFTDLFLGYFKDLSADFRDWASQVKGSTALQDFFDYVKRIAPEVGDFLKQFGRAALNLLEAVAPYGEVVLNTLTGFLKWIGDMDPVALGAIATSIFTLATAMQAIFGLTSLVKSAQAAWHLATGTLDGFTGKVPLLVGGAIALAGGLVILYNSSESFRNLVDTLAGALADLIGWMDDGVGPVGLMVAALASFVIAKQAAQWLGLVKTPTAQLATAADMLGDSYGRAAGKVGLLTKALGVAAAAGAGLMLYDQLKAGGDGGQSSAMAATIADGGKAAADLRDKVAKAGTSSGFSDFLGGLTLRNLWDEKNFGPSIEKNFDDAKVKAREAYDAMNPLERAQQDVTVATNELALAQEKYGVKSDEARAASDRLRGAQGDLETKQGDLEGATRDATDALIAQANAQLAAADSDIAFEQAGVAARRAQEKYAQVLGDSKASVDDRKEAELGLRSAYLQVAGAALRQAQDQASLRGETLTSTESANAQLQALKTLRDEMGGKVPEAINTLIANLEATAGTAAGVSAAVDGVTGAIAAVPGQKSVTVNALTDEAKLILEDLGIKVQTMEDGTVTLLAEDDPAQLVLDTFIAEAQKREITIPVRAGFYQQFMDDVLHGPKPNPNGGSPAGGSFSGPGGMWVPAKPKATGGAIEGPGGPTSDSVPILASDGEYMIRASSVAKYGVEFMDLINAGRFASGGLIGGPISIPRWTPSTDISAIDVSPLAQMWGETVNVIGAVSGDAAPLLAAMWAALNQSAQQSVTDLRTGATAEWTGMAGELTSQTDTSLTTTEQRFRQMGETVGEVVGGTRDTVRDVWGDLRTVTADPVNFVINSVLNAGLFAALNSVAGTFGLDKTIPPAQPVVVPRFATGGRVPGSSPHKAADNILAQLTAGEFVQPVDSVQYYGSGFMEALRKRQIPKDALPAYANGGLIGGSWPQLDAIRAQLFPGSVMTSGYRPGARDHHGAGNAIDIGVPGNRPSQLAPIARRIAMLFPNSLELINNPGGSIKNGRPVPPSFWGPATWAAHADHVHWAATAAQIAAGALGAQDIPTALTESIMAPIADMFSTFGKNGFTQLLADAPNALADVVWAALASSGDDGNAMEATLYDSGGYLPPGLSMVLNRTGKPEPVLTAEELNLLRDGGGGIGGGDTWDVDINEAGADGEQIVGTLMHRVRVIKRGGKYARS